MANAIAAIGTVNNVKSVLHCLIFKTQFETVSIVKVKGDATVVQPQGRYKRFKLGVVLSTGRFQV